MDNDITVVHDQPTGIGLSLDVTFPFMLFKSFFDHPIGQSVQHAVAGGGADNKVIREGSNFFYIQQDNIFAFFIFQGVDYCMCKFKCIQMSPRVRYRCSTVLSRYYDGFKDSAYKWM